MWQVWPQLLGTLPHFIPTIHTFYSFHFRALKFFPFKKIFLIYLFIFGCIESLSLRPGFLQLRRVGATLRCGAWASHCGGFSCCGARPLGARTSVVVARVLSSCGLRALELRLSSCGTRAQLLCSMWDLPRPGIEPMSPALAGGFLTTALQGKPKFSIFIEV